jgi:outer membrane cobalamin receptor
MHAQHAVSGKITDNKGKPLPGANVYIDGTYDGASAGADGTFHFTTTESGNKTLVVSLLSYETSRTEIDPAHAADIEIRLRESLNALDAVVLTAGTFEAGDKARVSVLKPLDIVTTAGSAGNIVAALQTLPGTQTVGEDGRLFVRGGEADETQTFVDGIRVPQPYNATTNNLPTRGRFSPFLFSGISFSTGGYSAEFGEALSSVLLLNTQDDPDQDKTDVSLMTVGLGVGHTKKWEKRSASINVAYFDLSPYDAAFPQDVDWNRPYQSLSGEGVYREHFENGLLKVYAAFDASRFDLNQKSINAPFLTRVGLQNDNFYFNTSYKGDLGAKWQLFTGFGYGLNKNVISLNLDGTGNTENALQYKLKFTRKLSQWAKLSAGADYFLTDYRDHYDPFGGSRLKSGYQAGIGAAYVEADIFFSNHLAAKAGFRASRNDLLDENVVVPRFSLAYKIRRKGQFSVAYGMFTQAPKAEYLKFSDFHQFDSERADHYLLNYQYSRDKITFRAEGYYKQYRDLVRFSGDAPPLSYSNDGNGYAKGIDVFWRDGRTFRNLEYWLSYSYIDTKRNYKNYPYAVTPDFVANTNVSVVTKYWIESLRSQLGVTNTFASGRPFNDPNQSAFMASKTRSYNSLSVSWAYLLSAQKILYFSVSNVLGNHNVFGYEYADSADASGHFDRKAVLPTADRFFFVGFFWTISDDRKSNQLNNL